MNYSRPKQTEIRLERTISAAAGEVYDVWLDAKSPGGPWFGSTRVLLDAKVDGLFYHATAYEGREWAHYGRFMVLDRPRRIEHTWVSEGTRGLESVVTLTFVPEGDRTRVTLHHAGVPDDDFGRQHQEGWVWMLGAIQDRFEKRER
jgi:uncharacterized protein YndB with AHSA1/START domain